MAQAEFTSAEHVKRQGNPQRGGAKSPAPLWEAAAQPVQQGQRVGRGGRQAAAGIKRSAAPRGPIADGAALAPYKRFAGGKTLAQAEFTSAEHVKRQGNPQRGGAFSPAPQAVEKPPAKERLVQFPRPQPQKLNQNPSFPGTCASEMTLLMAEGVTFSQENEPLPPCGLSRKSSVKAGLFLKV